MEIKIRMKRGGYIMAEAVGRCVRDSDGAGQTYEDVEDLILYWPCSKARRSKKSYVISPALYDTEQAEQAYWDACESRRSDPY